MDALIRYQNIAVDWYGKKWKLSLDDVKNICLARNPDFLLALGDSVWRSGLGQRRMNEAMERVVDKTKVTDTSIEIPSIQGFNDGIIKELTEFDWSILGDAAITTAQQIVAPVETIVVGVSDSATSVAKNLKWVTWVAIGILVFVGYKILNKKAGV